MIYHVAMQGCGRADGSANDPFKTINRAARVAGPCDTVRVHEGVYRETVVPRAGGAKDNAAFLLDPSSYVTLITK